jgi:chromosome partitioning protein
MRSAVSLKGNGGGLMISLTVSNQRGGVGKTTTVLTLARCLADRGQRVLVVDTDSQGSVWITLGTEPIGWLHEFMNDGLALSQVATKVHEKIDVIASDRRTMRVEATLSSQTVREMVFYSLLQNAAQFYDVVLFDVAPSISHLHSCAIAYSKNVLIPVAMDRLSLEGASSTLKSIEVLNHFLKLGCRAIGYLPTMVDRRTSASEVVLSTLEQYRDETGVPIIHPIRTDQAVNKALRNQQFLQDWDPKSKALEDYNTACDEIFTALGATNVQTETAAH